jgi:hypothetical protein
VRPHLEPLTDQQLISVCGLQQTSTQAEDAMCQGMEKLQHNVTETLTVVDTFFSDEAYMLQMDNAVDRLKELVVFVAEVSDQPNRCRTCPRYAPAPLLLLLTRRSLHAGGPSPAHDAASDAQDPDDAAGGEGPPRAR